MLEACTNDTTISYVSKKSPPTLSARKLVNQLPQHLVENEQLTAAIDLALPKNYSFEIQKTLWRIEQEKSSHVGLQFPEGLLTFGSQISNILLHFSPHPIQITILGDVTYGACCIDDLTARSIGVDLLVHYGHSCLVPMPQLVLRSCLYVFVDIVFDYIPLVDTIMLNFPPNPSSDQPSPKITNTIFPKIEEQDSNIATTPVDARTNPNESYTKCPKIGLMGTIQYSSVIHSAKAALCSFYGDSNIIVPQELPLTAGEVLGCTSPILSKDIDCVIFVADGRFHLESALIHNPTLPFYRYDPFTKKLFRETYRHAELHKDRQSAISAARDAQSVGIILGTLGRQGSVGIFERLRDMLNSRSIKTMLLMMSEIAPDRLTKLASCGLDAFIQVGCPRLSLDWGQGLAPVPVLTPYEAFVAFANEPYKSDHRSGSLGERPAETTSFSNLEQRRALIRQRAEARRANRIVV